MLAAGTAKLHVPPADPTAGTTAASPSRVSADPLDKYTAITEFMASTPA